MLLLVLVLALVLAGCGSDYSDWTPSYESDGFDSYQDLSSYSDDSAFYYPDSYSYEAPRKSEFRFDYGEHHGITEQDYEQIREMERLQAQAKESERRSRLWRSRSQQPQQYEPYSLDEQKYQRYQPLDELSPGRSRSKSYYRFRPLYKDL